MAIEMKGYLTIRTVTISGADAGQLINALAELQSFVPSVVTAAVSSTHARYVTSATLYRFITTGDYWIVLR